jgi:hypothetical protein
VAMRRSMSNENSAALDLPNVKQCTPARFHEVLNLTL